MGFVQGTKHAVSASASPLSFTFGSGTTAGNTIVGCIFMNNSSAVTVTATFNSVSCTTLDQVIDGADVQMGTTFILGNVAGGATVGSVAWTGGGSFDVDVIVLEESNCLAVANPTDVHTGQLQNGVTNPTSGNVVTNVANDNIVGFSLNCGGTTAFTAGSGFTLQTTDLLSALFPTASEDSKVQVTPGTTAAVFTNSQLQNYLTYVVAIKPPSGVNLSALRQRQRLFVPSKGPTRGLQSLKAFPPSGFAVSMAAATAVQLKAAAASTSQLAATARSEIQIKARATATGAAAVTAHAETMVKAAGGLAGATAMTGRTAVQVKSAAVPTMAAAIAGRATAMLKSAAAAAGVVPLAGLATTMVKAAGGITTGSFVALAARAAVMVKASAAATSQAALSARATTMTKANSAATGATAMAGQAAIMVKAAGAIGTGALVALTGMCTVMVKAAAQQAQAATLAAHLTLQVKAQSPAPVPTPAAGQFQLITSMAGFFNPGSSAIP
jgi:hypothetical protein